MNKRGFLLGAAGVCAAGAGGWLARRHGEAATLSPAAQAFWSTRFERPEGGEFTAASLHGRPLLLNFWATWCAPCVRELPEIQHFLDEHQAQGWQVLALAVDAPTPVREFLRKLPLRFPIGLAGLAGTELSRTLGNSQGGLPFSVAFDARGEIMWRKLGATTLTELQSMAGKKPS